jgi:23S rRNA G2445 N2-methylase RlmL
MVNIVSTVDYFLAYFATFCQNFDLIVVVVVAFHNLQSELDSASVLVGNAPSGMMVDALTSLGTLRNHMADLLCNCGRSCIAACISYQGMMMQVVFVRVSHSQGLLDYQYTDLHHFHQHCLIQCDTLRNDYIYQDTGYN